jgi:hypothetical protein
MKTGTELGRNKSQDSQSGRGDERRARRRLNEGRVNESMMMIDDKERQREEVERESNIYEINYGSGNTAHDEL